MSTRASPVSAGSASSSSYPCARRSRSKSSSAGSLKRSTRARTPQWPGRTIRRQRAPRPLRGLIAPLYVKHTCVGPPYQPQPRRRRLESPAVRQLARNTVKRTCAICERTLLIGERSIRFSPNGETFVDVCPLCQDAALEHGWLKEGSPTTPTVPTQRRRRGLASLFDLRRGSQPPPVAPEPILRRLSEPELEMVEAAELFNASDYRRTVGGIAPWNFPIAIPSWKIVPALVCGNTIVFKPATDTPLLGERFVELLDAAGVPAGVVNVVHGGGGSVGDRLVRHPDVPVITITGSRETGVEVLRNAAENLKHVHLELGGKNAIIVLDDADLDLAVEGIVWSAFGTSGQRCTAASRVIVQEGVYDALSAKLVAAAEAMRLGPGWEDDTDVGPVINKGALEKIHSYTEIGKDEGAKLLTGGEVASGDGLDKGFYYRPTIFGDVEAGMRIAQEEIFGPTMALIRVRDLDEAIRVSNGIKYGLSSSIFTRDVNTAFRAMRDLVAGITYINAGTIGAEVHLPFGGTKQTGNGHREAGQAALDVFTEWKSIYVDYSGKLQKAQIDTAT